MGQDVRYAQEQAQINLKAVSDRVYLKFTGEVGQVEKNKVVPIPKDTGGSKPDTEKTPADRVLRLGFLGEKFEFKPGDEKLVPRTAAKAWTLENLRHWEHKVVLVTREPENEAEMRARLLKELKAEPVEADESSPEPEEKRGPGRPKKTK